MNKIHFHDRQRSHQTKHRRINEMIRLLRMTTPDGRHFIHTLDTVGERYGVTRERIRQLTREGGYTRTGELASLREQNAPTCAVDGCLNPTKWSGQPAGDYAVRCTVHAQRYGQRTELECATCGVKFERLTAKLRQNTRNKLRHKPQAQFFCTKSCQSKYFGKTYGFGAHPENGPIGRAKARAARSVSKT